MGRNLNRQDAKCAKETQDESPEISSRASKLRFPSVWLGELGVLAVKSPLHSGFCHEALPGVDTLVFQSFHAVPEPNTFVRRWPQAIRAVRMAVEWQAMDGLP
jgi:hypothetical protein